MAADKGLISFFLIFILLAVFSLIILRYYKIIPILPFSNNVFTQQVFVTPTFNPYPYQKPEIPKKKDYTIFLVGDSMVKALGDNADGLRSDLIKYYPGHDFANYNYGFGATNVLSLKDRLNKLNNVDGKIYKPIINEGFDLIIIESFAYNPLSDYPLTIGLQKQTESLDYAVKSIIQTHPYSVVAIMVTIAPSKERFAQGAYDLSPDIRKKWADERISYLENAIQFAQQRNLPLINVYEKSLTSEGIANLKFISQSDYIHPSGAGISLMSQTISDYIYQNNIFQK